MKRKDWSVCSQNRVHVPKFVCIPNGLDSLKNKDVVFASLKLHQCTLANVSELRYIEKATGFGGSYREIIMKKFRIFYQTKLGGLYLMVLL